ncbi:MAG TPA: protease pro-enzyme activation domain-containing protein, partial [Opitutaceae bacterium]
MFPDSVRTVEQSAAGAKQAVISRLVLRPAESAATMSFEVSLRMRHFDEMQSRIARGELISDAEKAARYFPLAADHDRVIAWLRAQGLEVTRTDGNHLGIFGRGSVDGVAKAFRVSFARVVAVDGREFTSAVTAPSLPGDISPVVLGIHGLQPHIRRHALSTPRALRPDLQINLSGYTPAQLATAYNATGLGVTGAGQTIAIYSLAYPQSSDLTLFWSEAQVTPKLSNITNVDVAGGPVSPSDPSAEEAALDVEWV